MATVGPPMFAPGLNQKEISSVTPSESSTSLAGIPSLLQLTQAKYWLWALGRGRGAEPVKVLEWMGRADVLLLTEAGGLALVSPLRISPSATSAHVGEGGGGGVES